MRNSKVAIRYATSLLDLALEKKAEESAFNDMQTVSNAILESKELANLLTSPVVNSEKKSSILKEVFKGKVSELSISFIDLIVQKKRENLLSEISSAFINAYKANKNIVIAVVTSATPLDAKAKEKVAGLLNVDSKQLEITEIIDTSVIGGFIVKVGDQQIDTTVKSKLLNIKHEFSANLYEPKVN